MKKRSLTRNLIIIILLPLIVMLALQLGLFFQTLEDQRIANNDYCTTIVSSVGKTIDGITNNIAKMGSMLAFSKSIQGYLTSDSESSKLTYAENISELVSNFQNYISNLTGVILLDNKNNIYNAIGYLNIAVENQFIQLLENDNYTFSGHFSFVSTPHNETYLLYAMPIFDTNNSECYGSKIGYVGIVCSTLEIEEQLETYSDIILNIKSTITNMALFAKKLPLTNDPRYYYSYKSSSSNLEIVGYSTEIPYTSSTQKIMLFIAISTTFILFFVIYLFFQIHKIIINPIAEMNNEINKIDGDITAVRIKVTSNNEISSIAIHINEMLDKIHTLNDTIASSQAKIYETQIAITRTELYAYQSQINPHFLYNSLQCMRGIALMNNMPEIADISTFMADLFRYSIKGAIYVSLQDELDIIKKYLFINNIRLKIKLIIPFQYLTNY